MAKLIDSAASLKTYILRRLGGSFNEIEISDEQLEDRIDDAIQKFYTYHYDGVNIEYIIMDLEADTSEYDMAENVVEVLDVITSKLSFDYYDDENVAFDYGNYFNGGLNYTYYSSPVDVEVFRQQRELHRDVFEKKYQFDFNRTTNKLRIFAPPTTTTAAALKIYTVEESIDNILNNEWIRDYATALCREQWAVNLGKFDNVTLPGGVTLRTDQILQKAETDIEKLLEQLKDDFSLPPESYFE